MTSIIRASGLRAVVLPLSVAGLGSILLLFTWFGLLVLFFGLADAHGRYRDFVYLSRRKMTTRLAVFYGRSMCGRKIVTSVDKSWVENFYLRGYRWYHFLPDDFFRVIRKPLFWRTLVLGHVQ